MSIKKNEGDEKPVSLSEIRLIFYKEKNKKKMLLTKLKKEVKYKYSVLIIKERYL